MIIVCTMLNCLYPLTAIMLVSCCDSISIDSMYLCICIIIKKSVFTTVLMCFPLSLFILVHIAGG